MNKDALPWILPWHHGSVPRMAIPPHKNKTTSANYLCFIVRNVQYRHTECFLFLRRHKWSQKYQSSTWIYYILAQSDCNTSKSSFNTNDVCFVQTQTKSMDKEKQACICKVSTVNAQNLRWNNSKQDEAVAHHMQRSNKLRSKTRLSLYRTGRKDSCYSPILHKDRAKA